MLAESYPLGCAPVGIKTREVPTEVDWKHDPGADSEVVQMGSGESGEPRDVQQLPIDIDAATARHDLGRSHGTVSGGRNWGRLSIPCSSPDQW